MNNKKNIKESRKKVLKMIRHETRGEDLFSQISVFLKNIKKTYKHWSEERALETKKNKALKENARKHALRAEEETKKKIVAEKERLAKEKEILLSQLRAAEEKKRAEKAAQKARLEEEYLAKTQKELNEKRKIEEEKKRLLEAKRSLEAEKFKHEQEEKQRLIKFETERRAEEEKKKKEQSIKNTSTEDVKFSSKAILTQIDRDLKNLEKTVHPETAKVKPSLALPAHQSWLSGVIASWKANVAKRHEREKKEKELREKARAEIERLRKETRDRIEKSRLEREAQQKLLENREKDKKKTIFLQDGHLAKIPHAPVVPALKALEEVQKREEAKISENTELEKLIKIKNIASQEKQLAPKAQKTTGFWSSIFASNQARTQAQIKATALTEEAKKKAQELAAKQAEELKRKTEELKRLREQALVRRSRWVSPEILKTNLIKDEIVIYVDWNKNLAILMVALFCCFVIIFGARQWVIMLAEKEIFQNAALSESNKKLQEQIKNAQKNNQTIQETKKNIDRVSNLLSQHVYWTNLFKTIERLTIKDVKYSNFSGNTSGVYSFDATTSSFNVLAEQVDFMKASEQVKSVNVNGGTFNRSKDDDKGYVQFTLNISINPDVFRK